MRQVGAWTRVEGHRDVGTTACCAFETRLSESWRETSRIFGRCYGAEIQFRTRSRFKPVAIQRLREESRRSCPMYLARRIAIVGASRVFRRPLVCSAKPNRDLILSLAFRQRQRASASFISQRACELFAVECAAMVAVATATGCKACLAGLGTPCGSSEELTTSLGGRSDESTSS